MSLARPQGYWSTEGQGASREESRRFIPEFSMVLIGLSMGFLWFWLFFNGLDWFFCCFQLFSGGLGWFSMVLVGFALVLIVFSMF